MGENTRKKEEKIGKYKKKQEIGKIQGNRENRGNEIRRQEKIGKNTRKQGRNRKIQEETGTKLGNRQENREKLEKYKK